MGSWDQWEMSRHVPSAVAQEQGAMLLMALVILCAQKAQAPIPAWKH